MEADRYGLWRLDVEDLYHALKSANRGGGDPLLRKMLKHEWRAFRRECAGRRRRVEGPATAAPRRRLASGRR
jgi:hypothetical protein